MNVLIVLIRTIRLLLDTRAGEESPALGLGIDREMALAIYRVGREDEFAEVFIYKSST